MGEGRSFTEEEVKEMMNRQALNINLNNFFVRALSNPQAIGLTKEERDAGDYAYRVFMAPPQAQPQKTESSDGPGTD
jgi:hypothetical protein